MKIRLMGLPEETTAAVEELRAAFEVLEVSAPRPNRGDSRLVRVYAEVQASPTRTLLSGPPDGDHDELVARVQRARNTLAWARTHAKALLAQRDKAPAGESARRKVLAARAEEVTRVADQFDKALHSERDQL